MSNLLRGSGLRFILKRILYFVSDIIFIIPVFIVALLSRPIKKNSLFEFHQNLQRLNYISLSLLMFSNNLV